LSGKATIRFAAHWLQPGRQYGGTIPGANVKFFVDGALVKVFAWMYRSYDNNANFLLFEPISVECTANGLSQGTHNFQIAIASDGAVYGAGGGVMSIEAGQAYITDFRR
jgi:hypothetical protein